jgi:hypothetical protein
MYIHTIWRTANPEVELEFVGAQSCVEAWGRSGNGARPQLRECTAGVGQRFVVLPRGERYMLRVPGSKMCLDVRRRLYYGAPVQLWECTEGNPNQLFAMRGWSPAPVEAAPEVCGADDMVTGEGECIKVEVKKL